MSLKNQKPNLRPRKIQSARFLIWVISGFYLLAMAWFLLSAGKGAHEPQAWVASAVTGFTVAYGVLMMLLWPHEEATPQPPSR
jgi:apolipoprotein N-acyltransferase